MNNIKRKLPIGISVIFAVVLVITAIVNLVLKQWKNVLLCLLTLICLPAPFIITHIAARKKLVLPSSFQTAALLFIFAAQYLGETVGLYRKLKWWDLLLHGIFGIYSVITALHLTEGLIKKEENITQRRFIIFILLFAFSFTITLGVFWELFELAADYIFKTQMAKDRPNDSLADLAIKIAGALLTSVIYYFRSKKNKGTLTN